MRQHNAWMFWVIEFLPGTKEGLFKNKGGLAPLIL